MKPRRVEIAEKLSAARDIDSIGFVLRLAKNGCIEDKIDLGSVVCAFGSVIGSVRRA